MSNGFRFVADVSSLFPRKLLKIEKSVAGLLTYSRS